jgi:hypothetical protein
MGLMVPGPDEATERRRPRPATLRLEDVLDTLAREEGQHLTGGPSTELELAALESALGFPLPADFRAFLLRLGGGLFFNGHEIFGPRRVMRHDIELVPDILSMRRWLARDRPSGVPEGFLPIHRARGVVHLMDARPDRSGESVVSLPAATPYPDLASFLETVVLPRSAPDPPAP